MIKGEITKERMLNWRVITPEIEGMFEVISPSKKDCEQSYIYRLNLTKGREYYLKPGELSLDEDEKFIGLEINAILIKGKAKVEGKVLNNEINKLDSFYLTKDDDLKIIALDDCVFYIGGAIDEGYGNAYFRKFDIDLPIRDIHQIHGLEGSSGQREVFMTCGPEVEASRLLVGITWSNDGQWTSWPPHQHERELEETYCYFDIDDNCFGMQLSYIEPGDIDNIVAHTVKSGVFCMAPRGYHPTVAIPGSRNAYVWIMCAHSHENRRYDLAKSDPTREKILKTNKGIKDYL